MTEEDHDWVRDALASTRSEQPVPSEVAARLDARLAELQQEQRPRTKTATDTSRGRRVGPLVLAAAAVAAVVAIGVPVVRQMSGSTSSPSGGAGSAAASAEARDVAPQSPSPTSSPSSSQTLGRDMAGAQQIRLHAASFATDAAPLVAALVHPSPAAVPDVPGPYCDYKVSDPGVLQRPVLLDGQPALLAVYPGSGDARPVKALSCTDGSTLADATVPLS